MLRELKERMDAKRAKARAIEESKYWKGHPVMLACLQAMRGSCTLAPQELHEAAIAAVNIAIREGSWIHTQSVPADFLSGVVYIVWADEKLPVLCAPWELAQQHLPVILSDQFDTLLVSETMERIIWFAVDGEKKLYSIA